MKWDFCFDAFFGWFFPKLAVFQELISFFKSRSHIRIGDLEKRSLVIGMVGYPNVGKSSTINKLLNQKKVSVSATPGKTRHLQTLMVDEEVFYNLIE